MATWLLHQESVDRFTVYLQRCRDGEYQPQVMEEQDPASIDNEPGTVSALSLRSFGGVTSAMPGDTPVSALLYRVAAHHPSWLRDRLIADIVAAQGASQLIPALQSFLQLHRSAIHVYNFHTLNLYKQLVVLLPSIVEVSDQKLKDIIHACPPVLTSDGRVTQPARLDFALVRTGECNAHTDGTVLKGQIIHHNYQRVLMQQNMRQAYAWPTYE